MLLLPECHEEELVAIAERIREAIRNLRIATGTQAFSLTVSIGVHYPNTPQTLDAMLQLADKALYAAKDAGRDCVRTSWQESLTGGDRYPRVFDCVWNWVRSTSGAGCQPGLRCSATTLVKMPPRTIELGGQAHETGLGGGDQVVQHAVGHVLVEMPFVAERPDIQLQALQFHAFLVGDVIQDQGGEIRLAGLGAQAGEFRDFHVDVVIALGLRIGKSL